MSPSICPRCGRPQVAKLLAAADQLADGLVELLDHVFDLTDGRVKDPLADANTLSVSIAEWREEYEFPTDEEYDPTDGPRMTDPSQSSGIPALDEKDELRAAAMDVVLTWDTNGSQHMAMPRLRKALGLPGEPPTREEAQARLNAYHGIESGS